MEDVLAQAAEAGGRHAHCVLLRLPLEVRDLFWQWLNGHYPDRAEHFMSLVQQSRSGQDYESAFGVRMRGQGPVADIIVQRFHLAARRASLDRPTEALSMRRSFVRREPRRLRWSCFDRCYSQLPVSQRR